MQKRNSSKESMYNLFNRYVWLVDIIYRRERITFEEINDYWQRSSLNLTGDDIPLRTFHNHRKAIEQMFDINIECDKRGGYQYYIENVEDMERGGVRSWLLNTFAVNNLINESHRLKQRILFEKIPSGQVYITPVVQAMQESRSLEITYQSFWNDSSSTFEVHPYCLKIFKQRWYLIAFSPYKERILIYGLDRIKNIQTTGNSFQLPDDFNGESFFANSYGIIVDDEIGAEIVRVKVGRSQDRYFKSLPLHSSQEEEEVTSDYTIFRFYIKPTFDFRQALLSYGSDIEAHNSPFDSGCLKAAHDLYGIEYPDYTFHCTCRAAKKHFPGLQNYQLQTVARHIGYNLDNHHHALADAEACARIVLSAPLFHRSNESV